VKYNRSPFLSGHSCLGNDVWVWTTSIYERERERPKKLFSKWNFLPFTCFPFHPLYTCRRVEICLQEDIQCHNDDDVNREKLWDGGKRWGETSQDMRERRSMLTRDELVRWTKKITSRDQYCNSRNIPPSSILDKKTKCLLTESANSTCCFTSFLFYRPRSPEVIFDSHTLDTSCAAVDDFYKIAQRSWKIARE